MKVTVAFASETLNSAEAAATLCVRLRQLETVHEADVVNLKNVVSLFQFVALLNRSDLLIFIIPTWGKGQPPRDLLPLWTVLHNPSLEGELGELCDDTSVAVFGLGDRKYPEFNYASLSLYDRLKTLGLQPDFVPIGLGDAQHDFGYEGEFDPWCDTLFSKLDPSYSPPKDSEDDQAGNVSRLEPRYTLIPDKGRSVSPITHGMHEFVVLKNERITSDDHFQDVRKITLKPMRPIRYDPTDVLAVMPRNNPDRVDLLLQYLKLPHNMTADTPFTLCSAPQTKSVIPGIYGELATSQVWTLRSLFTDGLEIEARPTRFALRILAQYAKAKHRKKLEELSGYSLDGRNLYDEYIRSEKRSYPDLFEDFGIYFKSLPIEILISLIPQLAPRSYSIASSQLRQDQLNNQLAEPWNADTRPTKFALPSLLPLHNCIASRSFAPSVSTRESSTSPFYLVVGIVEKTTVFGRNINGVTTDYLSRLGAGDSVRGYVKCSENIDVKRLMKMDTPVIGVGPGTGVAPVHALMSERHALRGVGDPHDIALLGVRHPEKDALLQNEWVVQSQTEKYWAYSRPDRPEDKQYVQDIVRDPNVYPQVLKSLLGGGCLLISGSSAPMPQEVLEAIAKSYDLHNKESESMNGTGFVKSLLERGQIYLDTWEG